MSLVLVREHGPSVDLGPTIEGLSAFSEIGQVAGDLYPQLNYVPQANDEPLPDDVVAQMADQAEQCLEQFQGRLGAHALWILEQVAALAPDDPEEDA